MGAASSRRDFIGIAIFSLPPTSPSTSARPGDRHVESHAVAHGRDRTLSLRYLEVFPRARSEATSSEPTSPATPIGKSATQRVRSDWSNNHAENRAIVIHNAWYADPT